MPSAQAIMERAENEKLAAAQNKARRQWCDHCGGNGFLERDRGIVVACKHCNGLGYQPSAT